MSLRGIERRLAKLERKLTPPPAPLYITERSPRFHEAVAEARAAGRKIVIIRWRRPEEAPHA
jgi:hypothetical protein